jgi:transcriptional antiterminator RfaH
VVTQGPFAGVEAIFEMADGEQRVMVLLNILSKQVRMSIPPAGIKKLY